MAVVEARDLSKTYTAGDIAIQAIRGVSFTIPAASFVSFVGPSGSGKSTLLNMIGCLDPPTTGTLTVAGQDVAALSARQAARFRGDHIGFIFQDFNLIPVLTVFENVEYPLLMVQHWPPGERKQRVEQLLGAVGMADQAHKFPHQISGGQKQRVAVARALVTRAELILADEPTANLDRDTALRIIALMKAMRDEFGTTFVFSTHDPKIVDSAETVHTLEDGVLVAPNKEGGSNGNVIKIAFRNLRRYQRRTLLTLSLITLGVVAVLLFLAVSGSFKQMMIGQITDAMLGHLQIHQKGYLASIDTLPLNRNLNERQTARVSETLASQPAVAAFSPRIKLGAMLSNYTETTNIRLNGIDPDQELRTVPLLADRILEGKADGLLARGEILVPELLARGMQLKPGDDVVLVATNQDGSVNGQSFVVRAIIEGVTGPGGRDGYIHREDAQTLLRLDRPETSEFAVRLKDAGQLPAVLAALEESLGAVRNPAGKQVFEIHGWQKLTPFANIARMIDLMTLFIRVMLVAIVLVSIMNVMVMAVYERIHEIGTIAAIGTGPGRILALFLTEGLLLGILGAAVGVAVSLVATWALGLARISFDFGQQKGLVLAPTLAPGEVVSVALIVIAIAVVGSLQPAWKAARMDPITALRHV